MIRFLTAGESHGPGLVAIIDGLPAGLPLAKADFDRELARRQLGFGRGGRMKIERDEVEIVAGIRAGLTIGSPVAVRIANRDWDKWHEVMGAEGTAKGDPVNTPRPGHADLPGALKTGQGDIRNILERASARETAARVAAGVPAKRLLAELGIEVVSQVLRIGPVAADESRSPVPGDTERIDDSPVRCLDSAAAERMVEAIKAAQAEGDTLGGLFEVLVFGCPPGIGGYAQWDQRLSANLARAVMSIPAIKGIEIGLGFHLAEIRGSQAHDEILYSAERGYYRDTNRAGGIEGGMTNGEPIKVRAVMKPIPTLGNPLASVDMGTKKRTSAHRERSDICAVPSAAVIGEAVVALELAVAVQQKFGGDSLAELIDRVARYKERLK